MGLRRKCQDQTQTGLHVREDPDDTRSPAELLVVPLQHVRGLHPRAMFPGQAIHRQRLLDMILDPVHQLANPFLIAPMGHPMAFGLVERDPGL